MGGNRTRCAEELDIALRTVRNKLNDCKKRGYSIPKSRVGKDE
ncbi:MAG: hypothetical protein LBQ86_09160 [Holophagales bacterium]|nr:hypothetical protein [Holophagales bacterium]